MKQKIRNAEQGFSLVELMVVVAIIGVLAAMSVGQVQKQIAKARQSEVKTNLSTIYTAEKAFQAEWAAYTTRFQPLNVNFEGAVRYDVGFGADFDVPVGFTGTNLVADNKASDICTAGAAPVAPDTCNIINSNGAAPTAPAAGATATATTFSATGSALIYANNAGTQDLWTIDTNKTLTNTTPGIF